ncbi:MAG: hypothetical protein LH478_05250 [Chitinophagaceae bacterium]|nr:hypothetical protein [Chitinophagaceae bacterium]
MKKAHAINEVYNAIEGGRPLTIEEMDAFYCNTDAVRNDLPARKQLAKIIKRNAIAGRNGHILFVGARGSGKSTELNHLQKDLKEEFAILNYSVMRELDPQSISYIELFIVTMEKLFSYAIEQQLKIADDFINRVTGWTKTKEVEEIKDKHLSAEASAGINTKIGIPFLQEFFFKLKGAAKASKSFKETLKDTIEPRLSDLIEYCNELISEIRIKIQANGFQDLLIIIEDLDKIPLARAKTLFFDYANQIVQLQATVIYTFPVTLYYNTNFIATRNYFSDIIELPMVKVFHKNGQAYDNGIDTLRCIVLARMDKNLFSEEAILTDMIKKTGGVIRDLFSMINDAADAADSREKEFIDRDDYKYAYNQIKKEYSNTVADYSEEGKVKYTAGQYYEVLANLAKNADKKPDNTEMLMQLRQNLCVLSYNGEGWADVNPIMKDILHERGYLN